MTRLVLAAAAMFALCLWSPQPAVAAGAPEFADYSAPVYRGPVHAPDLSSHPDAKTYRTQLQNAAKGGVNFAGDHILAMWGCGGQCLMGAVVNARTGHVQFLPGTVCCWLEAGEDIDPIAFKANSDLLVLTGLVNEEEPMASRYYSFRSRAFLPIETRALGASAPGAKTGGVQPAALFDICYYDSRGAQHDADWCTAGGDISIAKNVNLSPHCRGNAGAVCQLGNSGSCRPGAKKYSTYVIFPYRSGRCPTTFAAAVGAGGGQGVAPSCPSGYVLSKGQCVRKMAAPKAPAPVPAVSCQSKCESAYDRCVERVGRNPNADETFYEGCSDDIDQCKASCAIQKGDCYTYADGSTVCP